MSRLIDADAMLKRLEEWNTSDIMDKALCNFALIRIIEQPTIEPEQKMTMMQKGGKDDQRRSNKDS